MTIVMILLGVALALSLAYNLGLLGGSTKSASQSPANVLASENSPARSDDDLARRAEAELEKKTKELSELKKAHAEIKDELKNAKKRIFHQKENEKSGDDLAKARAEVERQASVQLEATRHELANALSTIQKLKAEAEGKGRKRPVEPVIEKKEEPKPQEVVTRVIRELSDVEKERIAKLETQSTNDRKRANELDRELRSIKGKLDRHQRESKRVYSEANLARDKFRAVEMRLNRTILENDLLKRAIKDLEKKSGVGAGRLDLTQEEIATSDQAIKAKHAAEDAAEAEARAKLEAAPATPADDQSPTPATNPSEIAEVAAPPPSPSAQA